MFKPSDFVAVLRKRAEKRKKQRPQHDGSQPRWVLAKEPPDLEKRECLFPSWQLGWRVYQLIEKPLTCSLFLIIVASVQNLVVFTALIFTPRFFWWRHECLYSNLSTFLEGLNSQRNKPQVGNYSATAERCVIFHQKTQHLFFKSFANPACFRWEFCCVSLVGSDPSEMGTNYMLLVALVPSSWPPSARHQGKALTIADTVKGHLYCDQVKCCGKKHPEKIQPCAFSN